MTMCKSCSDQFDKVEQKVEKLKSALLGLIGVETKEELEMMEVGVRVMSIPDKDKTNMLNAIHVLIGIMEE